jgi:hypothetical protein
LRHRPASRILCCMAKKREQIRERDVTGLKYFRRLLPLFERLRQVGCGRDKAGNRRLHMDQYCALVLLFLFNPCLRSLRALQQASELWNVQRRLGCPRTSLGSLSEATDVFDPERLREIIGELAEQTQPVREVAGKEVQQLLTAVDGSVVQTLSTVAQAAYLRTKQGQARSGWSAPGRAWARRAREARPPARASRPTNRPPQPTRNRGTASVAWRILPKDSKKCSRPWEIGCILTTRVRRWHASTRAVSARRKPRAVAGPGVVARAEGRPRQCRGARFEPTTPLRGHPISSQSEGSLGDGFWDLSHSS